MVETIISAVDRAISQLLKSVPAPALSKTASGQRAFRFNDQTPQQAILLKLVRLCSALRALDLLMGAGLTMDAGASMRILDETGADIQFLAGPVLFALPPERNHERFLAEFFQEEFDHSDPVLSTQKRDRVSRKEVRAYIARVFHGEHPTDNVIAHDATIYNAFSGFVHGAGVHILDTFDRRGFDVPASKGHPQMEALEEQYSNYLHRALMDTAIAAKALGDEAEFERLNGLQLELFTEYGHIR